MYLMCVFNTSTHIPVWGVGPLKSLVEFSPMTSLPLLSISLNQFWEIDPWV